MPVFKSIIFYVSKEKNIVLLNTVIYLQYSVLKHHEVNPMLYVDTTPQDLYILENLKFKKDLHFKLVNFRHI